MSDLIARQWAAYSADMPISEREKALMHFAFYAGATGVFNLLHGVGETADADNPTPNELRTIMAIGQELEAFAAGATILAETKTRGDAH